MLWWSNEEGIISIERVGLCSSVRTLCTYNSSNKWKSSEFNMWAQENLVDSLITNLQNRILKYGNLTEIFHFLIIRDLIIFFLLLANHSVEFNIFLFFFRFVNSETIEFFWTIAYWTLIISLIDFSMIIQKKCCLF